VSSLSEFDDGDQDDSKAPKLEKEKTQDSAIKVTNLSLTYRTTFTKNQTLRSALRDLRHRERNVHTVEALKDVSFEIPHGTVLGVIGRNGAGKSSLLRTLTGIMPPTAGRIEVHGRISTLLALGVAFNTELSGSENILLAGLASGMTRDQVAEKRKEITDFAEIGEFIDLPTKTYSSGMSQRLAFSVAVHMNPDILLIDEALSAGDAKFKEKAQEKMHDLMKSARTLVLVSHGLNSILDMCNDAIWLDKGQLKMHSDPKSVVDAYSEFVKVGKSSPAMLEDL
jgi:ABC-2 type transport system ATP-binding protein/teichoic acid transport system ATP-binding protein